MYYEDDIYGPNYVEDQHYHEDDAPSLADTVNTHSKKQRKLWEDSKKSDPGFIKIKRKVGYNTFEVDAYISSSNPGVTIRDAITGAKFQGYKVGSSREYELFKVRDTTCKTDKIVTLFFETPEAYERHMKCTVSTEIKSQWADRYAKIQRQRVKLDV
jgi:hypothetical protein